MLKETSINQEVIKKLEEGTSVVIAHTPITTDIEQLNEEIIFIFERNKLKLNKFWITEETIKKLNTVSVTRLYDQGVSKYKVLTKFMKLDNYIYAIGMPLPQMNETINIVNKFYVRITFISILLIIGLIIVLGRRIVKPLENLKEVTKDIARLNFKTIDISSNDEVGELAESINKMSESLEQAHHDINSQNRRLKQLLSDISHELKTPLALINIYAQGIEDDLDDGTYLKTIKEQVTRMSELIEKLLFWAKLDNKKVNIIELDLRDTIEKLRDKYKLIFYQNAISFKFQFQEEEEYLIKADKEAMEVVLDNLITNAIKYTNNNEIVVKLKKEEGSLRLGIINGIDESSVNNLEDIWTPFYVVEKSRNKNLSGTGLGLSIVKSILENHNFQYGFNIIKDKIEFYIVFL